MVRTRADVPIQIHLTQEEWTAALRQEAAEGLAAAPRVLSPTWLYDDRGCELYDEITRLPEYYPTRTERGILADRADEVAALTGAETLVELGAGTSEKTRLLLDALVAGGTLRRFTLFDVAAPTLRTTALAVAEEYPTIEVDGIVGDFRRHLDRIPGDGRRLVAFLGGTIGNLDPAARAAMLADLASAMRPGESLLLGTDLVKDTARLVAAYDDAAGVTAEFNRNVLSVLNRELGADFDVDGFEHVARFDDDAEWIEMRLRATAPQVVSIPGLGLTLPFGAGDDIRTEISAKFRPERVRSELEAAGLSLKAWWTDPAGDFALSLAVR